MPWNDRTKRRLKLRDLDILATLIDAGSMGKAAARLNVSQPAVSKAIAELEAALGVRLVDRGRRGITPTPYGLALKKRSVAIFNDLRQGVQDIDFLSDPATGELRIGTTDPLSVALVSPCIDRLSRKHPRMTFHVVADDTAALYREVMERNIELAICRMLGPLPGDLAAEVLFHDSLAVLTSAKNPLTRRRKLTLDELVNEPWVQLPPDILFGAMVADLFRASGYEPPRPTVVTHSEYLKNDFLAKGRFLTVLPRFMLNVPGWHPRLKALPVDLSNTRRPIGLITLNNRMLTPLAQLFIANVRMIAKGMGQGA
ncbi:MAG TPA: LysR family transcriptional regulator [Xanthobacteraceae bacterium]|nr:LysR family transcriptional regulator [Xanthobacteraceae bacterium]